MKVALVGDAQTSRHLAPFDDPTWEIWGIGTGFHLKRCTRMFEIHDPTVGQAASTFGDANYRPAMLEVPDRFPGVIMYKHPKLDLWMRGNVIDFPFDEVLERYDFDDRPFFTGSVCWMVGYALMMPELTDVAFYGVDHDEAGEYREQRAGGEHWVGYARGRGVRVTIPKESLLCRGPYLYGLEDAENAKVVGWIDQRRASLQKDLDKWTADEKLAQDAIRQMDVRLGELGWIDAEWNPKKGKPRGHCSVEAHRQKVIDGRTQAVKDERERWLKEERSAQMAIAEFTMRLRELDWASKNQTIAVPTGLLGPLYPHPLAS